MGRMPYIHKITQYLGIFVTNRIRNTIANHTKNAEMESNITKKYVAPIFIQSNAATFESISHIY